MKVLPVFLLFVVLLTTFQHDNLCAQNKPDTLSVWVSPGVIIGYSGNWRSLPGIKAGIEGCVGRNMYFEANYSANANFDFFESAKPNSITELKTGAALLGVRIPLTGRFSIAGMTGLSFCTGKFRGKGTLVEKEGLFDSKYTETEFERSDFSEAGIPVYAKAFYTGYRLGASLTAYSVIQNHFHYGLMIGAMVRLY